MTRIPGFVPCLLCALLMSASAPRAASPFPPQVELRVPFAPTAFPAGGRLVLLYELHMTNFSGGALDIRSIEVIAADEPAGKLLAAFEGEQLASMMHSGPPKLDAGDAAVAYLLVAVDPQAALPGKLRHRLLTADASVEGAETATRHRDLKTLGPPVRGAAWHAYDGPSNDRDNHHRRGLLVLDGSASISRRFATDWFLTKAGHTHEGDGSRRSSYYSYGQPVLAVADATVVAARDGMPDNDPGLYPAFRPAVPVTLDTATGNFIVLDLGGGQFALYCHLQPGSLRVKTGARVRQGEELGRIGVSGDANLPHLHFEVTTSPLPLRGEGLPYVIDRYRVKAGDGEWRAVIGELPMRNAIVDFGQPAKDRG